MAIWTTSFGDVPAYDSHVHIVAAPDKFKGTATAREITAAICRAASEAGHTCTEVPLADGGDGTLEALGGANRVSRVTGPLGEPVDAEWRLEKGLAVIEMARTSGLVLAGGRKRNDPLAASTTGVGELIGEAVDGGAETIIVGVGGSATTDGGLGAIEAIGSPEQIRGVDLIVACDVRTKFVDAARVFGPQKGATDAQVALLQNRLVSLVETYKTRFGVDVSNLERGGAAGGLSGGLAALGARLEDGFQIVAEHVALADALEAADLVVTGEGFIDNESFDGKVVGGVATMAATHGVSVLAIAGQVFDEDDAEPSGDFDMISLTEEFGLSKALKNPTMCVYDALRSRF